MSSSYLTLNLYRDRCGRLCITSETSAGRGEPVQLFYEQRAHARTLARLSGAELPGLVPEHLMSPAELAQASADLVERLKSGAPSG